MASFTYFTGSRPIVALAAPIPLPILESDIRTALGTAIVANPGANDTIAQIVATQTVMSGLSTSSPDYTSRANAVQTWMRQLGLYPNATAAGPSPILGV